MLAEFSLLAVFLTGLLGGVHCAGMCGGIVSALGMASQRPFSSLGGIPVSTQPSSAVSHSQTNTVFSTLAVVSLYNLGRISMYTMLGALAGAVGSVAWLMESVLPVQQFAYLLSNLLLVVMGLYVIGVKRIALLMESIGVRPWSLVRPIATRKLTGKGHFDLFFAGALWGLVPCGMVYAILSTALVSGSGTRGALLMLVFGLGTLPNLTLLGMSGQWLAKASRHRAVRIIAGLMIIGFGLMGMMHLSMMTYS